MTDMGRSLRTYYDERLGQGLSGVQVVTPPSFSSTHMPASSCLVG